MSKRPTVIGLGCEKGVLDYRNMHILQDTRALFVSIAYSGVANAGSLASPDKYAAVGSC